MKNDEEIRRVLDEGRELEKGRDIFGARPIAGNKHFYELDGCRYTTFEYTMKILERPAGSQGLTYINRACLICGEEFPIPVGRYVDGYIIKGKYCGGKRVTFKKSKDYGNMALRKNQIICPNCKRKIRLHKKRLERSRLRKRYCRICGKDITDKQLTAKTCCSAHRKALSRQKGKAKRPSS